MAGLNEILMADGRKEAVLRDCVEMVEQFVSERGGLKGMAYRTGLGMLKKAKPGTLDRAAQRLFPEFLTALEPFYREHQRQPAGSFEAYLSGNAEIASRALLNVADQRVAQASDVVQKTYARFRGGAEDEVRMLLPMLGQLVSRHLKKA